MSSTTYYITDTTGFQAGPAGGSTGGGSGQPLGPEFQAPTIAAAAQVAYLISSAYQRPVMLVTKYAAQGTQTLVVGLGAATALTQVPSGITY